MIFSVLIQNKVASGWNFKKLILNKYDHGVIMHCKFHQGVIRYIGFIRFILKDFENASPRINLLFHKLREGKQDN